MNADKTMMLIRVYLPSSTAICFLLTFLLSWLSLELPQNLPQHPQYHGDVASGDFQAADQAAHFFVGGGGGDGGHIAAFVQHLQETQGDLFGFSRGGGADLAGAGSGGFGIARQLVEAKGDRLTEVHGEILAYRSE